MKINVLGTEYEIMTDVKEADDENLTDCDGYIDYHTKEIVIAEMVEEYNTTKDIQTYWNGVVRHELVHAFLYESGLSDYAGDERIVEWIALQIPKLKDVFEELNIF